jgi:multidrug efflux pump subunit AcrA (membrane-fusion protein)
MTTGRSARPWPTYALGALCAAAIVAAILVVGPASGSQLSGGRTITAAQGVVQSTVSGSGNIQAATQLDLGFKTSGVVTHIYVSQGAHVTEGQLLAELDPKSAEVTLEQARAALQSAAANLVQEEENDGEGSSGTSATGTGASKATASDVSAVASAASTMAAPSTAGAPDTATATAPAQTAPSQTTHTQTAPTRQRSASNTAHKTAQQRASTPTHTSSTTPTDGGATSSTTPQATTSAALREANIASARAAVKSDQLTVRSDEEALADTKLFAPQDGTLVSLSGEVGETVSAKGTTKSSSSSSSGGSGSGSSASSAVGLGASATGTSASGSADSSSASSSAFAVLSDLSSMQLVVPLSESEVGSVEVGQPAAVTIEALEGRKLAAHVVSIATLPTSTSGVVSYDVTFQLDQLASGLKPGMSATAEVVVKQAEGVNVPSTAISAGTVTVVHDGKQVRQRVLTGLVGNSTTIVLSGLKAGEEVVLPVARTTSASGIASRLGSRLGGGAGVAGGLGAGGGGAAFFGGGGGFRGG